MAVSAIAAFSLASPERAVAADLPPSEPPTQVVASAFDGLQWHSPFAPCDHSCAATIYVGKYVATPMTDIFLKWKTPPWHWRSKDTWLVSGSFSRPVLTYGDMWRFETEIGAGKRFGRQEEGEFWAALYFRWLDFPWNDVLRTSVAISTGIDYATHISAIERRKSVGHTDHFLHYLSPEITFGLPSQPNLDLVFRFHHRSGGNLGVFNHTGGGSQYQTVGLRYTW